MSDTTYVPQIKMDTHGFYWNNPGKKRLVIQINHNAKISVEITKALTKGNFIEDRKALNKAVNEIINLSLSLDAGDDSDFIENIPKPEPQTSNDDETPF